MLERTEFQQETEQDHRGGRDMALPVTVLMLVGKKSVRAISLLNYERAEDCLQGFFLLILIISDQSAQGAENIIFVHSIRYSNTILY